MVILLKIQKTFLNFLSFEAEGLEEEFYEQDDLIMKQEQARDLLESGYFPKAIELLTGCC